MYVYSVYYAEFGPGKWPNSNQQMGHSHKQFFVTEVTGLLCGLCPQNLLKCCQSSPQTSTTPRQLFHHLPETINSCEIQNKNESYQQYPNSTTRLTWRFLTTRKIGETSGRCPRCFVLNKFHFYVANVNDLCLEIKSCSPYFNSLDHMLNLAWILLAKRVFLQ